MENNYSDYKKYIEDVLKSEKGIVKKRLLKWGAALNMCEMKQEEIQKIKRMKDSSIKIFSKFDNEFDNKKLWIAMKKKLKI